MQEAFEPEAFMNHKKCKKTSTNPNYMIDIGILHEGLAFNWKELEEMFIKQLWTNIQLKWQCIIVHTRISPLTNHECEHLKSKRNSLSLYIVI
jgi:hypothetical protein